MAEPQRAADRSQPFGSVCVRESAAAGSGRSRLAFGTSAMKRILAYTACLGLGIALGWYFGNTRPVAKQQRQLLEEYRDAKEMLHMTDAQMTNTAAELPDLLAAMKQNDRDVAMVGLRGIEILDRGDVAGAKKYLAYWIGSYYRVYHTNGDTNLIARIERAAQTNAVIAAEIAKKTASYK